MNLTFDLKYDLSLTCDIVLPISGFLELFVLKLGAVMGQTDAQIDRVQSVIERAAK